MIRIDDARLEEDKVRNIRVINDLIEAAMKDHQRSPIAEGKFFIRAYERKMNAAYPGMDNKTAFQTARRSYNRLEKDPDETVTTLGGADVYRIARFFLRNLGGYGWPGVKRVLMEAGTPYDELTQLEDEVGAAIPDQLHDLRNKRVGDLIPQGQKAPLILRELADQFEELEKELKYAHFQKKVAIEQTEQIRKQVVALPAAFNRILKAHSVAPPELQTYYVEEFRAYKELLVNLRDLL
ncbi:hypothetical protein [Neolewinella litorea]|uniref:Uncharacterized protein n=1 Tax=Neolewinella litorea TaxID=2562452 RepID=A0A4S4NDP8_9BACT|nr:hypothetical protein [Neolewinella litorea]THH37624.1 hypothetical protein E4021_14475 [Neolewinella litorea]